MKERLLNFLGYKAFNITMLFVTDIGFPILIYLETTNNHKAYWFVVGFILKALIY